MSDDDESARLAARARARLLRRFDLPLALDVPPEPREGDPLTAPSSVGAYPLVPLDTGERMGVLMARRALTAVPGYTPGSGFGMYEPSSFVTVYDDDATTQPVQGTAPASPAETPPSPSPVREGHAPPRKRARFHAPAVGLLADSPPEGDSLPPPRAAADLVRYRRDVSGLYAHPGGDVFFTQPSASPADEADDDDVQFLGDASAPAASAAAAAGVPADVAASSAAAGVPAVGDVRAQGADIAAALADDDHLLQEAGIEAFAAAAEADNAAAAPAAVGFAGGILMPSGARSLARFAALPPQYGFALARAERRRGALRLLPATGEQLAENPALDTALRRAVARAEVVAFPVNVGGNHWIVLAADVPAGVVWVYDSLRPANAATGVQGRTYAAGFAAALQQVTRRGFVVSLRSAAPRQSNAIDCGVFAGATMRDLATGRQFEGRPSTEGRRVAARARDFRQRQLEGVAARFKT